MSFAQDLKLIENECAAALSRIGIVMKSGIGTLSINNAFHGWIGLNSGRHEGFIRINPFIGVHCPEVMKLAAMASGKKYRPGQLATFAAFIGELCPNISQFVFSDGVDAKLEAERMAAVVEEYGLPYMRSIGSYDSLLPLLKKRVQTLGGYPQRYAASLYLSGDPTGAIDFVDEQINSLGKEDVPEVVAALKELKNLMDSKRQEGQARGAGLTNSGSSLKSKGKT